MENELGLTPLNDKLIVRRLKTENVSSGGIIIPDAALDPPDLGRVLATGPGRDDGNGGRVPMSVQVGDIVMFGKYCGHTLKHEGEDLSCIPEGDIIAICDDVPDNLSFQ